MFRLIFGLPWLYVVTRFVWPMPWPDPIKIAVALVLLVASQFHFWSRLSSGSLFNPQFPRPIVILFNWAFGSIVLLAVFQMALDLTSLPALLMSPGMTIPAALRYAIGATALALAAIGVAQAIRVPPLRDVIVVIPDLPPRFDG